MYGVFLLNVYERTCWTPHKNETSFAFVLPKNSWKKLWRVCPAEHFLKGTVLLNTSYNLKESVWFSLSCWIPPERELFPAEHLWYKIMLNSSLKQGLTDYILKEKVLLNIPWEELVSLNIYWMKLILLKCFRKEMVVLNFYWKEGLFFLKEKVMLTRPERKSCWTVSERKVQLNTFWQEGSAEHFLNRRVSWTFPVKEVYWTTTESDWFLWTSTERTGPSEKKWFC